jgi:ppGpp synthetase/RelA/SpoT-type nucleotidyltranferase
MDEKVIRDFLAQYDTSRSRYEEFANRVKTLVEELLAENGIAVHSVTAREKDPERLREKLQRTDSAYEALEQVTDLAGVRVITHLSDDVDRVGKIIESEFAIDRENSIDKRASLDPDRFGYLSLHYVASLSRARAKLTEYRRYPTLKVELQIRSILQHAWAEIEHDLGYKAKTDVPRQIRRRFSRIAGLLELADNEFVSIRDELTAYEKQVTQQIKARPESVLLDKVSLAAFVATDPEIARIDSLIASLYKRPIAQVKPPEGEAGRLKSLNIETIDDLRRALQEHGPAVREFAKRWIKPEKSQSNVRRGISLVYLRYVLLAKMADRTLAQQALGQPGSVKDTFIDRIFDTYNEISGAPN